MDNPWNFLGKTHIQLQFYWFWLWCLIQPYVQKVLKLSLWNPVSQSSPSSVSPQPWVTVARLQLRSVGPYKNEPESLAVWVTAPPLPPYLHNGILTTLALLFGPQNAPLPPLWFLYEKRGSWTGGWVCGCEWRGFLLAVWCQYGPFYKGIVQLPTCRVWDGGCALCQTL